MPISAVNHIAFASWVIYRHHTVQKHDSLYV